MHIRRVKFEETYARETNPFRWFPRRSQRRRWKETYDDREKDIDEIE